MMTIIQSLISTTAGTVMVLAILGILVVTCIVLGIAVSKKNDKIDHYEDHSMESLILNAKLQLEQVHTDRYDNLAYLMFRILYELIGERELSASIRKLTVLRGAHVLLDTDIREGARTIMKNIKMDDPDLETIMQYILSIMDVHGGVNCLSELGREDYYEMSINLGELQQTLREKETKLDALYKEENQVHEKEEEDADYEYAPETHSFAGWFKLMISGLKHPNDYYDEDEEEDDTE